MRPERLEVVGFGVFREATVIDFVGTDLFALSGPTGAGKSTVIDAVVFALYGSVPRYDNKNLVAPVISQGRVEARVRLDFAVGPDRYRIVRVVRAAGRGATTKEARFERVADDGDGGPGTVDVLAGTADEVTAAVEALLGLTYDHFTTCVVLPQGDFQRFLHQKPSARQDLLVELLDLGVYGQMAQAARARALAAQHERAFLAQELTKLAPYTAERRLALSAEAADLEKLLVAIDEALPVIEELGRRADAAAEEARVAQAKAEALAGLVVPAGVAEAADAMRAAQAEAEAAAAGEVEARAAAQAAETAVGDGTARTRLEGLRRDHEARATEAARLPKGEQRVGAAVAEDERSTAMLATARDRHRQVAEALERARRADRAEAFAAQLVVGEPCPVCLQVVHAEPAHVARDLARLTAEERDAAADVGDAEERAKGAAAQRARYEHLLADVRRRVAELDGQLAGQPDLEAIAVELAALDAAEAARRQARAAEDEAHRRRRAADATVEGLRADEHRARRRFDAARDSVAALGPPPAERRDLAADWDALVAWAGAERPRAEGAAADAVAAAGAAAQEAARRRSEVDDACRSAGVVVPRGRPARDVVVEHLSNVRADLESLDDALARRAELAELDTRLAEAEQVAAALGTHLRSTGFEKWVLDEVLQRLVGTATGILHELSGGTYSLTFDGRSNFCVVDHANADAVRSARTLSGGETFLASLALALALADEVASLAATGTVRLESIFLDEGFGTLDPDTLDTVATAIEELGARGRLVGLVTHVRDLAERLPVRFEITREGNASTVARVDR
jgi:exonuclease SbcC